MTKTIRIGSVNIGGGNPVAIQSMTNTDTANVRETVGQILALEKAGCEIVRSSVYSPECARALREIKKEIHIPLVADIHFDYRLAIAAIENGADKVRINPGNIGGEDKVKAVADAAKEYGIAIRVGANGGSLAEKMRLMPRHKALVESVLENVSILEKNGFDDIVVSLKTSNVKETVLACRYFNEISEYPQHLGITEAGPIETSSVKSAMGIGTLLMEGIGDTIRVSVTGDPVDEILVAKNILKYSGSRAVGPEIVSCPTCGRTRIDLFSLTRRVEELVKDIHVPIKIAVMGCAVNGPGEARDADIGIAGGDGEGLVFRKGKPVIKVPEEQLLETFMKNLNELLKTEE